MNEFASQLALFGFFLSILAYYIGLVLQPHIKISLLSPFIIAVVLVIVFLVCFRVDYETYAQGADVLSYLLTPATVCLAIPLYQNMELLKRYWKGILTGITVGVLTNAGIILLFAHIFSLDHTMYVTLLPKAVTTAISIGISEELGGIVALSLAATLISGISGNVLAPLLCRLFRIKNPVARGIAIGTASHAIGTARALEMGSTEGGMSGLSIAIAGIITVIVVPIFAVFF